MLVNRVLVTLILMNLFMFLTVWLGFDIIKAIATLPPILMTLVFKFVLKVTCDSRFRWYTPDAKELQAAVRAADQTHGPAGEPLRRGQIPAFLLERIH